MPFVGVDEVEDPLFPLPVPLLVGAITSEGVRA